MTQPSPFVGNRDEIGTKDSFQTGPPKLRQFLDVYFEAFSQSVVFLRLFSDLYERDTDLCRILLFISVTCVKLANLYFGIYVMFV